MLSLGRLWLLEVTCCKNYLQIFVVIVAWLAFNCKYFLNLYNEWSISNRLHLYKNSKFFKKYFTSSFRLLFVTDWIIMRFKSSLFCFKFTDTSMFYGTLNSFVYIYTYIVFYTRLGGHQTRAIWVSTGIHGYRITMFDRKLYSAATVVGNTRYFLSGR